MPNHDGNYVHATASITLSSRERAHDTRRRLLYAIATAAGIFEPDFFWFGLQNEMWCICFFVVVGWTTRNQIFSVKYARVSSSHRKYQNNVFIRYFAKRFSNVLKTIKKCVCNAQQPGMRWYFAFRMNSIADRKSTTIEIKSDKKLRPAIGPMDIFVAKPPAN